MKRLGVLTSGGDAPGMNAAIRAVVLAANQHGIKCVGIRRGFTGLLTGDVLPLLPRQVEGITALGGTMLYTARSDEFFTEKGQRKGADNCRFLGMDALVVIGGNGSFQGADKLWKLGVPVVAIPGTIDNDIGCTTYTIGFDTACTTAIEAVDKLSDTMQSHERCSVVEVMGRAAGHLAMYVGISTGAAVTLIPEARVDMRRDVVEKIRALRLEGRTHFTVIVAEGAAQAHEIAGEINRETGIDTRVTTLGHIQRGGSPRVRDRVTASKMGVYAVNLLASGRAGRAVALHCEKCIDIDMDDALAMTKTLDEEALSMLNILVEPE